MTSHGMFVTVLGCMDGRCQDKTIAFAKETFGADHVDTITEPGIDKVLARGSHATAKDEFLPMLREWIKTKADISANGHGSKKIIITGHLECAGNPVAYDEHVQHLQEAEALVRSWGLFDEVYTAMFGDDWELQLIETVA